jgi:hypothetical protein
MKGNQKILRILYIIGIVALVAGILDPMEGSVVILAGSFLIMLSTLLMRAPGWKLFLFCFGMIAAGVFFLFFLSSLGGFGGKSTLSWWWGTLILPYPIGWLTEITYLIVRAVKARKKSAEQD